MAIRYSKEWYDEREERWKTGAPGPIERMMDATANTAHAVLSAGVAEAKTGRPHSGKQVVSLRLDPDVIEAFRATGPGWQARMNEALRKAMP